MFIKCKMAFWVVKNEMFTHTSVPFFEMPCVSFSPYDIKYVFVENHENYFLK